MAASIRLATLADAEDIARLTAQLGYEVAASSVEERLSRILAREDHQFVVAEGERRAVAGWLHAVVWEFVETGAFVVVAGLVVDRDHRRQGIGRVLMERAETWAGQKGCSIVRLWSSAARVEAHQFYQRLGYTHAKTQYAFIKSLGRASEAELDRFVPRIDGGPGSSHSD
jgi:GNAT superfamily N-acetyltransferase